MAIRNVQQGGMDKAKQIVESLGGTMKVAEHLGIAPSAVSGWMRKDRKGIPRWWHRDLKEMAKKAKVKIEF